MDYSIQRNQAELGTIRAPLAKKPPKQCCRPFSLGQPPEGLLSAPHSICRTARMRSCPAINIPNWQRWWDTLGEQSRVISPASAEATCSPKSSSITIQHEKRGYRKMDGGSMRGVRRARDDGRGPATPPLPPDGPLSTLDAFRRMPGGSQTGCRWRSGGRGEGVERRPAMSPRGGNESCPPRPLPP